MDYFAILNLSKEPFSNSPDPEFFFHSREHVDCLQKLELSLLLRRGLNVIIGDVGTGKTTLCRQLIRRFANRKEVETHLVLDPYFVDEAEFLTAVVKMFTDKKPPAKANTWQLKEYIKHYLFKAGVDEKRTVVLIIDEGQKIPAFCLELLREFLNYETNEYKLLQIVIFAQREFEKTIQRHANFADRISLFHHLKPLNFHDTRQMIRFRLEQSRASRRKLDLFSFPALVAIYRATGGYPRKIINLCHQCVMAMIIANRSKIGYFMVRSCDRRVYVEKPRRWKAAAGSALVVLGVVLVLAAVPLPGPVNSWLGKRVATPKKAWFQSSPAVKAPAVPALPAAAAPEAAVESRETPAGPAAASVAAAAPQEPPAGQTPAAVETLNEPAQAAAVAAVSPPPVEGPPPAAAPAPVDAAEPGPGHAQESPPAFPDLLGEVALQRNETLSRLIQRVYGTFNSRYFKSLILANPQIDDPDRVEVGQLIRLPAIAADIRPHKQPRWWVQVGEEDSLEAAYRRLRAWPDSAPPLRLVPYRHPPQGTRFALVLKQSFTDEAAARRRLERLSPDLAAQAQLRSGWGPDTVLFADPYLAAKRTK